MSKTSSYAKGQIATIHPASDWFMRGIKYATIIGCGPKWVTLHSALFNKTFKLKAQDIMEVSWKISLK